MKKYTFVFVLVLIALFQYASGMDITKTTSAQEGANKTYEYNISFKTPVNVIKHCRKSLHPCSSAGPTFSSQL